MGQTRVQRHTKPNQEGPQALVDTHRGVHHSITVHRIEHVHVHVQWSGYVPYDTTAPTATMPSCAIMSWMKACQVAGCDASCTTRDVERDDQLLCCKNCPRVARKLSGQLCGQHLLGLHSYMSYGGARPYGRLVILQLRPHCWSSGAATTTAPTCCCCSCKLRLTRSTSSSLGQ